MDVNKEEATHDPPLLPLDLLHKIFLLLPYKFLLRLKCVSKSWYHVINSPDFIKLHLSHSLKSNSNKTLILYAHNSLYTLEFHDLPCRVIELPYHQAMAYYPLPKQQDFEIMGSCNGLLCIKFNNDKLALYNPATQAYKGLPNVPSTRGCRTLYPEVQFSYDCISDDYKILRFAQSPIPSYGKPEWITFLYSLKINAWEIILNPPWGWHSIKLPCIIYFETRLPSILVNNALHWIDRNRKNIKCFDLFTLKYYEIALPEDITPYDYFFLAVLNEQLIILTSCLDIWLMKEYGVRQSWTQLFRRPSIPFKPAYSLWNHGLSLACTKDGCKILVVSMGGPLNFICCDLESQEAKKVEIPGLSIPSRFSAVLPWVESLVPLSN
ncbi:F-box protein CPR1-like [Beta vulgaris subsp. vulgaris]|uniref:F-box protein CPR1-like n=1 Tax=Beta vulgaris subsp. vulgaris TaxID=3555 RepID=UPI0020369A10|nr:F-box protein CPR1-like [Beta vulgaris subsp. vulgaris]